MFLETLRFETPKEWYNWKSTLVKMQSIDLTTLEWKFEMIVSILKVSDSLKMKKLEDGKDVSNLEKIRDKFAKALTYSNSELIVSNLLSQIATDLSFDIIIANGNVFDYNIYKKYLAWKATVEDFIFNKKFWFKSDKAWKFEWESWEIYTWLKPWDIINIRWEEMLDIVKNIKDEKYKKAADYIIDDKNQQKIKEVFGWFRNAWLSLLKEIITWEKWKLTEFLETL